MEALLMLVWISAIVLIAYRLFAHERSGGQKGLGIFAFRDTARNRESKGQAAKRMGGRDA